MLLILTSVNIGSSLGHATRRTGLLRRVHLFEHRRRLCKVCYNLLVTVLPVPTHRV